MNAILTGRQQGLYSCFACGRVSEPVNALEVSLNKKRHCSRCFTSLHHYKPDSLQRTWAYLLAALLLYGPANVLPIMTTISLTGTDRYTILGGIGELWTSGDWGLAIIVFIASIAVPILKIFILAFLAITAQRRSHWQSRLRTQMYRWVESVGHWSMLDVYVVVLLVGMIRFGTFAEVQPETGLLAFGCVVVLTILASASFDPRLLWPEATPHER